MLAVQTCQLFSNIRTDVTNDDDDNVVENDDDDDNDVDDEWFLYQDAIVVHGGADFSSPPILLLLKSSSLTNGLRQKYTTSFFIWNVGFMWDIVCCEILCGINVGLYVRSFYIGRQVLNCGINVGFGKKVKLKQIVGNSFCGKNVGLGCVLSC